MNDLEQQVREDLGASADGFRLDLDADRVLDAGRQAHRIRTLRRVAAGTALTVALAGLGWAGLAGRPPGGTSPVLATPVPVPTMATTSAPTATGTRTITVAPGVSDVVDLGVPQYGGAKPLDVAAIRVSATVKDSAHDAFAVTFTVTDGPGKQYRQQVESSDGKLAWFQHGRLIVGFLPHPSDWFQLVEKAGGASGYYGPTQRAFTTITATAFYLVADSDAAYPGVSGYIWRDAGVFRNSSGQVLPTVTLSLPRSGASGAFYLDKDSDLIGAISDDGAFSWAASADKVGEGWSWALPTAGGRGTGVLSLPSGASDPRLTSSAADLEQVQGRLGDRVVILVSGTVASDRALLVDSLTYTAADGHQVTKRFSS